MFPNEYVILDIETTGIVCGYDRIIEIAAVRYNNHGEVSIFSTLINPLIAIPSQITNLTGITQQDVENAPTWEEIQPQFLSFIAESTLIGHNIKAFDIRFINNAIGSSLPNHIIDTLDLSRQAFPNLPSHKLEVLKKSLNIDTAVSHRALGDVRTTHALLLACLDPSNHSPQIDSIEHGGNRSKFRDAVKISNLAPSTSATLNSVLQGKSIVFTGTLSIERKDAMQIAVDAGAIVRSAISKKTDYLVVGKQDISLVGFDGMSAKEEQAYALNNKGLASIQIIDEDTFVTLSQTEGTPPCASESIKIKSNNQPAPDERMAFESLRTACKESLDALNFPLELLMLKGVTEKSAICLIDENHVLSYMRIRKSKKYLTLPEDVLPFIPNELETYSLKSTPGVVYIAFADAKDITRCVVAFYEAIKLYLQKYHTFDCCGRYEKCSDATQCIHPNPIDALGCSYKKNLQQGRIFYGRNRNID